MLISADTLRKIATRLSPERAQVMADLLNKVCPKYGINSADILHEFLAQLLHESGEFTAKTENMNYSAARIRAVWPKRFPSVEFASKYAYKPVELANYVYGGRMGNNRQGEGWRYRGGAFIGVTGKGTYTKYTDYVNKRDRTNLSVGQVADLIRTSDEWALDASCWVFSVLLDLNDEAQADKQDLITLRVNGGYIGKKSRDDFYSLCKKYIA